MNNYNKYKKIKSSNSGNLKQPIVIKNKQKEELMNTPQGKIYFSGPSDGL